MKKLLIILAILACTSFAQAQVWHTANQGTFAWDAVTQLSTGAAIPAGSTVKYQPWIKPNSVSTGQKVGAEITTLQQTISFTNEGSFFVGVQALRYVGTELVSTSAVAWSDIAANCQGGATFGFRYWLPLMAPAGMRQLP